VNQADKTELDEALVKHIEATIRALRKEGPPHLSVKRVLAMLSLIAGTVVTLGAAVTWGVNAYTEWGWVTRKEYIATEKTDGEQYEARADYLFDRKVRDERTDRQDAQIQAAQSTASEILAYVKVVPQIKVLIKIRCMGNPDVQNTIEGLKDQYFALTKQRYVEPKCDDPEIRATPVR
jgi:hypothetical protein